MLALIKIVILEKNQPPLIVVVIAAGATKLQTLDVYISN